MRRMVIGIFPAAVTHALESQGYEVRPREDIAPLKDLIYQPTYRISHEDQHPNDDWRGRRNRRKKFR